MNVQCICCCTVSAAPLKFELSSRKLLNFSNILQAFGALMFLLEPKGRREKDEKYEKYFSYLKLSAIVVTL